MRLQVKNSTAIISAAGTCIASFVLLLALLSNAGHASPLLIDTFAGGNVCDGGAPTSASLNIPMRVAISPAGDVYIADSEYHRVRKIDTSGIITTVAGNGQSGNGGDYGLATEARLQHPTDIAFSPGGELYIADSDNHRIRKVTGSGIIVPVAGTGLDGFGGDGGNARYAMLNTPRGIDFDSSGNLYIADTGNNRIRKVTVTGTINTIAGNGNANYSGDGGKAMLAGLHGPREVAIDSAGNLNIADTLNHRIRKIYAATQIIRTVAGNGVAAYSGDGGPAVDASMNQPRGLDIDGSGNLYIADTKNNRIRRVGSDGIIRTIVGDGQGIFKGDGLRATVASVFWPYGVYVAADGKIYIADSNNNRVRMVDNRNFIWTYAGTGGGCYAGDNGASVNAGLNLLTGIAVHPDTGEVYIADSANNRIRKVASDGTITTVAGNGVRGFSGDGGNALDASLNGPTSIAISMFGDIYIADTANSRVRMVSSQAIITTIAGNGINGFSGDGGQARLASLNKPEGVSIVSGGGILIADTKNHRIRLVDYTGNINTVAGNGTQGFSGDGGMAVDASLNNPSYAVVPEDGGYTYISDTDNHRIRAITPTGLITTFAGTGMVIFGDGLTVSGIAIGDGGLATDASLSSPNGLAYGFPYLFFADTDYYRVRSIHLLTGIIGTVAGTGRAGFSGDEGDSINADISYPNGLVFYSTLTQKNLYIGDTANHRVRSVAGW